MKYLLKSAFVFAFCFGLVSVSTGNISIPNIFSSNMVLQQNSEVKIWGWAKSGEPVRLTASWLEQKMETKASSQGTWEITVPTPSAGGPFTVQLNGYNEITFENVLIGEVWLCSGQSNMEWSANSGIINKEEEIRNANYPNIRLFQVYNSSSQHPQENLTGEWTECSPETMSSFSAIGYFFARDLQKVLDVPIGIINSSWGGTPAETWMPEEVISNDEFLREAAAKQKPVPWGPVEPARLYNAMISPLIPFRITGALWYQGEGNTINSTAYKELLSGLIIGWRNKWGYEFPFYFAQIAPYKYGDNFLGVEVRDEQRQVLEIKNTGMVITSDIGDTLDIHPKNKQDVGLRFANMALNRHYKVLNVEDSGPLFKEMVIEKNKAVISFTHADGLHATDKKITCFEVAGGDGKYFPADVNVKDNQVIVQSKEVEKPVSVRFAWRNTATPNLFNGAGLPASSFKTE